jgi:formylglycine-generating enzyme required for sulfatase activity
MRGWRRRLGLLGVMAGAAVLLAGFDVETGRLQPVGRRGGMAVVPAGFFAMGSDPVELVAAIRLCRSQYGAARVAFDACSRSFLEAELPRRRVFLRAFAMDRLEVTNADFRACVRAGACDAAALVDADPRLTAPRAPVAGVTWDEARAFCRWRGGRLPTEAEWEKAARGPAGRVWPWGATWQPRRLNHGRIGALLTQRSLDPDLHRDADGADGYRLTAPVGSFPAGASPYGVLDLAGNVAEWTADVFVTEPPQARSQAQPRGPAAGSLRTVRGGSYLDPAHRTRAAARTAAEPHRRANDRGFRCVKDL